MLSVGLLAAPMIARSQSQSPVIQLLLTSTDTRTRIQAAVTLGRLRPTGARQALESALDDANVGVRASAAQSLVTLGDIASLGALRAHANDRDPLVRNGIARAIETLARNTATTATPTAAGSASATVQISLQSGDMQHARFLVRVGTLANRADSRPNIVELMRNAILLEVGRSGSVACVVARDLPPEAELRVRTGHLRAYAMEGSVNSLRRWTVAQTLSIRAEVSLVLMTHPSRTIVGSLSGAATAQEHTPYYDTDGFTQRLEERALSAAVHGALGNLQQSLTTGR
ncbi:MAG: HEAT repeat domain-containing protein [Deltaproteobacteria bacterium]